MKKDIIQSFNYLNNFQCIGPNCSDHCCGGWSISADEKTRSLYQEKSPELLNLIDKESGDFIVDDKGLCVCFGEDKLCNIHKNYGPEFLSDTCTNYPRNIDKFGDEFIVHANFSCPEITRLALLEEKDPFKLSTYSYYGFDDEFLGYLKKKGNDNKGEHEILSSWFPIIHNFIIENNNSSAETLIIFNSICFSLNYIKISDTIEALNFYLRTIKQRPLIPFEKDYQDLFSILFVMLFEMKNTSEVFTNILDRVKNELGLQVSEIGQKTELIFSLSSLEKFKEKQKLWNKFSSDKMESIFKKIVTHYLLEHKIPFAPKFFSPIEAISLVIAKITMFKFIMITLIDKDGNISDADIVNIVQSIARSLDHKNNTVTFLANLKDMNLQSEARLLGLIQTLSQENLSDQFGMKATNSSTTKKENKELVRT